jgi:hypothetical protein
MESMVNSQLINILSHYAHSFDWKISDKERRFVTLQQRKNEWPTDVSEAVRIAFFSPQASSFS